MYCNDNLSPNLIDSTISVEESISEIEFNVSANDKQIDQILDVSYSDSNYVSEDSTLCSEGYLDVKCEDNSNSTYIHDIEYKRDELIDTNIMDNISDSWLFKSPNEMSNLECNLSFTDLKMNFIITDKDMLLSLLKTKVDVSSSVSLTDHSPLRNIPQFTSTPIAYKQPMPSHLYNNTFIHKNHHSTNASTCDTKKTSASQNRTFVKVFPPTIPVSDSFDLNECISPGLDDTQSEDMSIGVTSPTSDNDKKRLILPTKNPVATTKTVVKVRRAMPQLSALHGSTMVLPTKGDFKKPAPQHRQSVVEPVKRLLQHNRKSNMVAPRDALSTQSKLVRPSSAVIPQNTVVSKIVPPRIPTSMSVKSAKPPYSKMQAPSTIPNTVHKTVLPRPTSQNIRPTVLQSRNNTLIPKQPLPSEFAPIVSPAVNFDDNPLNRTFDKNQFLLLKSVTNIEIDNTDTTNNNNSTIYKLAQAEEANLRKEATNITQPQSTAPRGLKLPSKIQSRTIHSLKR